MPRWNSKKFFVTWSQCPESLDDIYNHVVSKRPVARAIGCVELHDANPALIDEVHPTGELPHVHFVFEFVQKLNTTNERYFDFNGYHPKIETVRKWEAAVNYFREGDGQYAIDLKYYNCTEETAADEAESTDLFAIASGLDRQGWTNYCHHNNVSFMREQFVWKTLHTDTDILTVEEPPTLRPEARQQCDASERLDNLVFELPDRPQSVVLLGPSGIGKTVWAKTIAPKPAYEVGHMDDLRDFKAGYHKSIIFDEIRFSHLPLTTQIAVVDVDDARSIHTRYKPARIPAGVQKFFTCTETWPFEKNFQIERRCIWINVYSDNCPRDPDSMRYPLCT